MLRLTYKKRKKKKERKEIENEASLMANVLLVSDHVERLRL